MRTAGSDGATALHFFPIHPHVVLFFSSLDNPGEGTRTDGMGAMSKDSIDKVSCPQCASEAVYRDGKARTGKQRYLCLLCGMQFTASSRTRVQQRPSCPACGRIMHLYKNEQTAVRFRCSRYPACNTYMKVSKTQDDPKGIGRA
jgi:transposase-like protein